MKSVILVAALTVAAASGCTLTPSQGVFVDYLIGRQCDYGTLPIPLIETVAQFAANINITNQTAGGRYQPFYSTAPFTGTISVTNGSAVVTGNNVGQAGQLKTLACSGGATGNGAVLYIGPLTGTDGLQRFAGHAVATCASETSISVSSNWVAGDNVLSFLPSCSPCAGLHYALEGYPGGGQNFVSNAAPANYYLNDLGFAINGIRTGNATYTNAFQTFQDLWWSFPALSRGSVNQEWAGVGINPTWTPRAVSLQGTFLRAAAVPGIWAGLRIFRDKVMSGTLSLYKNADFPFIYDQRDLAYYLTATASGCMGDPDPTEKQIWCDSLVDLQTNLLASRHDHGTAESLFAMMQCQARSFGDADCISFLGSARSHVTITGSPLRTVTLVNDVGSHAWDSLTCNNTPSNSNGNYIVFFPNAGTQPTSNAAMELYQCDVVDDHHLTLRTTYTGTLAANAGWMIAGENGQAPLAYTSQPYQMGLDGISFEMSGTALNAAAIQFPGSAATYNAARDAYRGYNDDVVAWLQAYGYRPATGGFYYYAYGPNCAAPQPEPPTIWCGGNNSLNPFSTGESQNLTLETIDAFSRNFHRTRSAIVKTFVDALLLRAWTPLGGCSDAGALYLSNYDPDCIPMSSGGPCVSGCSGFNVDIAQSPPAGSPKFYGQPFGVGNITSWFATEQEAIISGTTISGKAVVSGKVTIE